MAQFWLPGDSDFALAMREPNLLYSRKRPTSRVTVDWNKSITNGLVGAWVFGPGCVDLVTGRPVTDNSITFIADDVGMASRAVRGASAYVDTGRTAGNLGIDGSKSRTLIVAGQIDDNANASKPIVSVGNTSSNTDFTYHQAGWDDLGEHKVSLWGEDLITSSVDVRDKKTIWAVTYSNTSTRLEAWINGVAVGNRTATSINTANTNTLRFGKWGSRSEEFGGRFYVGYVFNRALSDEEIREISRRWFIPLMPANQSPFLIGVPAGGGAPTLSSPGVINVQSDRATPQVTLTF